MSRRMKLDLPLILLEATRLIDEHSLDQLTLGMLAEKLQIRPPSLYNHISGLTELKQKLAIYGTKKLNEVLLQSAVGRSGDDAIRAIGEAYIQFVRNHPGLYEATSRFPHANDRELQEAQQDVVQLAIQVLEVYKLDDELAIHMVRSFRSLLHGFASLEQIGGFGLPFDSNKSLTILIETFIKGLHSICESELGKGLS